MREATGDIWQYADGENVDAICVLTNMTVVGGKLIMGGGNALEARLHYPDLPTIWGDRYSTPNSNKLAVYSPGDGPRIVAFPTKRHPSDESEIDLIDECAHELVKLADLLRWKQIALPRPGCGLGGLDWVYVKTWLEPVLDDRFTVFGYGYAITRGVVRNDGIR